MITDILNYEREREREKRENRIGGIGEEKSRGEREGERERERGRTGVFYYYYYFLLLVDILSVSTARILPNASLFALVTSFSAFFLLHSFTFFPPSFSHPVHDLFYRRRRWSALFFMVWTVPNVLGLL